jgi:hypothetical protein
MTLVDWLTGLNRDFMRDLDRFPSDLILLNTNSLLNRVPQAYNMLVKLTQQKETEQPGVLIVVWHKNGLPL